MAHIEIAPIATISDRLKTILKLRDIKPIELAEMTGISKASISQYLSGKVKPKQDRIYLIAIATNVRPAWLMGYNVPRKSYDVVLNEPLSDNTGIENNKFLTEKDRKVKKTIQQISKYIKNVDENTQIEMLHRVKELYDLYQYKKSRLHKKRNSLLKQKEE